jgi:hypothetical protein
VELLFYVLQYGFVFGIANLAAFLFAPIFGRYGTKIGPKILYNCGAYLQGICGICFGFLTYINSANLFIGLSYLLRFVFVVKIRIAGRCLIIIV